jgi:hypothetical protein
MVLFFLTIQEIVVWQDFGEKLIKVHFIDKNR